MVSSDSYEFGQFPQGKGDDARGRAVAWFVSFAAWDTADLDIEEDNGFLDDLELALAGTDEGALRLLLLLEL
jgi:hypothetical protein